MSTTTPPNLGIIITSPTARKIIYGTYTILLLIAGAAQVAFAAIPSGQPVWLTAGLSVLAYCGVPVGALAVANTSATPHIAAPVAAAPAAPVTPSAS